jgi:hypothetical protein
MKIFLLIILIMNILPSPACTEGSTCQTDCQKSKVCDGFSSSCRAYFSSLPIYVEINKGTPGTSRFYEYCITVDHFSQFVLSGCK